ncbi:MAG: flippase [Candidatus Aenigmarchaeota archaeon]|nr:flippase [Candidatus Aenigmarchaeota archaeon]
MNYAERLFKGSAIVFGAAIVATLLGYALRLFLARSLPVTDFGLLYSIFVFIAFFSLFKDLGLGPTIIKFLAEFSGAGNKDKIKPSILVVGLIQFAIAIAIMMPIIFFSDFIAVFYFRTVAAAFPLQIIAVSFIIGTALTTLQHAAQGLGHVKIYSLVEPIRLAIAFLFVALLINLGVTGISYAYVLGAVAALMFLLFGLKSRGKLTGKAAFDKALTKKLMKFAFPVFIGGLSSLLLFYTDTIVLTAFRGLEDVGLYQAALPTSQLLWVLVNSLAVVLLPLIAEMWAKKHINEVSTALGLISKFAFVVVIPIAIIMIAFAGDILLILFGQAYLPAAITLQILAINSIFYTLFVIFSNSLIAVNKPISNTKITAVISVLNLILNILFVPQYGIAAAALSTLLAYFIGTVLAFYSLRKTVQIGMDTISLAKIFVGGILAMSIIVAIKTVLIFNILAEIILSLAAGLIFYSFFILRTKGLTKEELEFLRKLNIPVPKFIVKMLVKLAS